MRRLEIDLETAQKENQVISEQVGVGPLSWDLPCYNQRVTALRPFLSSREGAFFSL